VTRRRSNYHQGTLSPTRIAVLEALAGWVWTRTEDRWAPGLTALRSYITTHCTAAVPADTLHRRYPLGRWVTARRAQYQRGTLSPEQIPPGGNGIPTTPPGTACLPTSSRPPTTAVDAA